MTTVLLCSIYSIRILELLVQVDVDIQYTSHNIVRTSVLSSEKVRLNWEEKLELTLDKSWEPVQHKEWEISVN